MNNATEQRSPYAYLIGRLWSRLEFEEQAHARRGMREGFIYIESTPGGRRVAEVPGARCGS